MAKANNLKSLIAAHEEEHGSDNSQSKPPVTFIQSPHHSARNGAKIKRIVVHCTEIPLDATVKLFKDPNSKKQVSAHYVIGREGEIVQMVSDGDVANHCKGANTDSIGLEHVGSDMDTLTDPQTASSVALIRWLIEQYGISKTSIFGHDFTPGRLTKTSCPDKLFGPAHRQQTVTAWVKANI